ncbi:MAG TPA: aldo/keto reductase [Ideonella sp.]|uniref:aldo/keto reductase n=1 Tax=Ideonella sp. TaxID=1929293 RepID=UPI002E32640D|nr:aldo/keto reductase [Ideonella sp.]HEX5686628.1 aldo/keto reductase [Ideonella sp.]
MPDVSPRRRFLASFALGAAVPALAGPPAVPLVPARMVPSTRQAIPTVGLGTWITFNVGRDAQLRAECTRVVQAFLDGGGRVIDSSPMYGSSQDVVGHALRTLNMAGQVFGADKVWTGDEAKGAAQAEASRQLWGVPRFALLQVHNLLNWQAHLPMLLRMKAEGRVGHVGITTSEGRRHAEFEQLMRTQPLDFVQFTYNPLDREAERRLLPLAADRGMAVLVNRPFQQGALTQRLTRHALPPWTAEAGAASWAQLVLKFILAHPAVTCVIPATTQVAHVRENLAAARGPLPDAALRRRITEHLQAL